MTTDHATTNRPPDAATSGDVAPPDDGFSTGCFSPELRAYLEARKAPPPRRVVNGRFVTADDFMRLPDDENKPTPAEKAEAEANGISPLFGCLALLAFIALGGAVFLFSHHATKQETKKEEEVETGFVPLPDDGSGTFILPLGKSGFAPATGAASPKAKAASPGTAASPSRPANVTARGGSFSGMGTGS